MRQLNQELWHGVKSLLLERDAFVYCFVFTKIRFSDMVCNEIVDSWF